MRASILTLTLLTLGACRYHPSKDCENMIDQAYDTGRKSINIDGYYPCTIHHESYLCPSQIPGVAFSPKTGEIKLMEVLKPIVEAKHD